MTEWPSEQKNGPVRSGDRPESSLFRKSLTGSDPEQLWEKTAELSFSYYLHDNAWEEELKYLPFQHQYRIIQRTEAT